MFKYNNLRVYVCTLSSEEMAGRIYDIALIQLKGMQAKTNFPHSKAEILAML